MGIKSQVRGDRVAVVVVADLLEQRLSGALGDAAVDLALEQHRVEDPTGVVTARRFFRQGDLQGVRFKPDILPELAFGPPRPVLTPGALVPMAR